MQPVLEDLLARRRDRAIAIILRTKEETCDAYLPDDVSARLRKVVLDQINSLTDVALDLISSLDTGETVLNELFIQKIDEIHAALIPERI